MAYTYEITERGYKIYNDENLLFTQEDQFATVFPGDTFEKSAQNHITTLIQTEEAARLEAEEAKRKEEEEKAAALKKEREIVELKERITQQEQQLTDAQLAMTEMFELMLGGTA